MDVGIVETFLHTVEDMRSETGIHYGAIILDDCYSAARIELILTQIMSKTRTLYDPNTGQAVDTSKIAAVISTVSSGVTISTSLLMMEFNIPVISSTATSPDLDDKINFPFFLRTLPSDVEQAKAMTSVIQRLGWQYVSVLYVKNNYGRKGKDAVTSYAKERHICIADHPEDIPDVTDDQNTPGDLREVATRLNNHQTDVVIYFGTDTMIVEFLKARSSNSFIFLGSEDWGDRPFILEEGGEATLGSLTMKNEVFSPTDESFANYLKSVTPKSNPQSRNPWFSTYWEEVFECDLKESFTNKFNRPCDENATFDDDTVDMLMNDQRILHTAEAVRAVTIALKRAKDKFCKAQSLFPCGLYFTNMPGAIQIFRNVSFQRNGHDARIFNDDGNGNVGFLINNVQRGKNGQLYYSEVCNNLSILAQSFKPQDILSIQKNVHAPAIANSKVQCNYSKGR